MKRIGAVVLVSGLVVAAVVTSGCATTSGSSSRRYTEQNLSNASGIRAGMAQGDVLQTMKAAPIRKDIISTSQEEWHYCRTGSPVDQFVAIVFVADDSGASRVASVKNYTVTPADTGGEYGDCSLFIKMGNYSGPRPPAPVGHVAPSQPARNPFSGTYNVQTYNTLTGTTTVETWSNGGKKITTCHNTLTGTSCFVDTYP